jgi:hypothetical protein
MKIVRSKIAKMTGFICQFHLEYMCGEIENVVSAWLCALLKKREDTLQCITL